MIAYLTLGKDGFSCGRICTIEFRLVLRQLLSRFATDQLRLFQPLHIVVVHLVRLGRHVFQIRDGELDSFPLCLRTKCLVERRALNGDLRLMLLQAIFGIIVPD